VKAKDGSERVTYSVRLNPDLLKQLKHLAVDENKTVGELIEEGIKVILQKRKK
jgi:predicted transcriptional regulator